MTAHAILWGPQKLFFPHLGPTLKIIIKLTQTERTLNSSSGTQPHRHLGGGPCLARCALLFHQTENTSTHAVRRGAVLSGCVQSEAGGVGESPGSQASVTPLAGRGVSRGRARRLTRRPTPRT